MAEISDEELERRMREKLFASPAKAKPLLSVEDQKIAAKLMGEANARRLANADRPFRFRAPVVIAEYYELPGDYLSEAGWRIDVIEDGNRREHRHGMTEPQCMADLRELIGKGATARKIETEWMKRKAAQRRLDRQSVKGGRKAVILDRLKEFRI